jgi:hypothetical protein
MCPAPPANDDTIPGPTLAALEAREQLRAHLAVLEARAVKALNAGLRDMADVEQDRGVCLRILARQALIRLSVSDGPEAARRYASFVFETGGRS